MPRVTQPAGTKGSLRWIQHFVNEEPDRLGAAVRSAADDRLKAPIEWLSPLRDDEYAEYRDRAFIDRLGVELADRPLLSFWPRRGPQWDALGRTADDDVLLVEAKAHVPELVSPPSQASPESLARIKSALDELASGLGMEPKCDWSSTFYQYTNRLAHLYLLRELNGIDAWLVFVCFVGDEAMDGPSTEAEWKAALQVVHGVLGLRDAGLMKYVLDVFVNVRTHATGVADVP